MVAEHAAHARFLLLEPTFQELELLRVDVGRRPGVPELIQDLNRQVQDGARRTHAIAQRYEPILAYGRPTWTVAALTRQARAYELLAQAVRNATVTTPDARRQQPPVSPSIPAGAPFHFEDQARQVLEQQARPIECLAVVRYARAARAARAADIDTEHSREARDRLQAYGDARIGECIAEARQTDPALHPYRPGELARARHGQLVELTPGVSAPPLAREDD